MNEPKKREFRREVHRLLRTEGKRFAFGETLGKGGAGAGGEVGGICSGFACVEVLV